VISFDEGDASEFNTLPVTDWFALTPPEVLAKNFAVPAQTFARIPLQNPWIYRGTLPGDLASDRAAISKSGRVPPHPFIFRVALHCQLQPRGPKAARCELRMAATSPSQRRLRPRW
jgi:oxalate decarboxylase